VISQGTAYALAAICMVIWGSPPVVSRAVSADVPPLALALARWVIALVVLLPIVWRKLPEEWPKLKAHWRSLAALASFMTAGSSLSVVAVYFTTATNAVLVNASQPAITAVFAWLVARSRLSGRQSFGVALAFLGILVMVFRADVGVLATLGINIGDLIMLGAVVGWSLYAVYLHHRDYVPSSEVLLFVIALTGCVILTPLFLVETAVRGAFALAPNVVGAMIYLALFPTLLATFFWNLAVRALGPNRAAIFVNLIPISGATLAVIFLDERLYAYHFWGAAFVFTGIYFAARARA
jgi:drug/metabolite transporter (DMT)-like permease